MSNYYNAKRSRNIFDPKSNEPFKLSRSKIDLFLSCSRCFYLDRRLGVDRPPGFPFNLNIAVDTLLKKEFDSYRSKNSSHPMMKTYGIDSVPYLHEKIEEWRDSRTRGISYHHQPSNFLVSGGIDDIWINRNGELEIVDYKATSKTSEINIDADWQASYKRQMEVYQWLFRMNGFKVSKKGYFVYCNGRADKEAFDGKLEFDVKVIPYEGNDSWVDSTLLKIKGCLVGDQIPQMNSDCDFCCFVKAVNEMAKS